MALNGIAPSVLSSVSTQDHFEWNPLPRADPELDGDPTVTTSIAYDVHARALVAVDLTGTWVYGGAGWRLVNTTSPAPGPMTWNPELGQIEMASPQGLQGFDGHNWSAVGSVRATAAVALTYDWKRQQLAMLEQDGGFSVRGLADTQWAAMPTIPDAGALTTVGLAWDDVSQRVIARQTSGGGPCTTNNVNAAWDGTRWSASARSPAYVAPSRRCLPRARRSSW